MPSPSPIMAALAFRSIETPYALVHLAQARVAPGTPGEAGSCGSQVAGCRLSASMMCGAGEGLASFIQADHFETLRAVQPRERSVRQRSARE
jgi:hypothetical protein